VGRFWVLGHRLHSRAGDGATGKPHILPFTHPNFFSLQPVEAEGPQEEGKGARGGGSQPLAKKSTRLTAFSAARVKLYTEKND